MYVIISKTFARSSESNFFWTWFWANATHLPILVSHDEYTPWSWIREKWWRSQNSYKLLSKMKDFEQEDKMNRSTFGVPVCLCLLSILFYFHLFSTDFPFWRVVRCTALLWMTGKIDGRQLRLKRIQKKNERAK